MSAQSGNALHARKRNALQEGMGMSADHSPSSSVGRHNPDPDEIVRCGQEAWSRLKAGRSWDDYIAVGEAIRVGRHLAMLEAGTNKPAGSRYESIFGNWLRKTGFDALDKGGRKRLLDCLDHRDEIEAWRKTLPLNKILKLNHPQAVWSNWQKATTFGKPIERPAKLSPIAQRDQEIARLHEEVACLRRAEDDLFSPRDTAADIARLIADRLLQKLSPTKLRDVLDRLPQLIAERAELLREPMKVEESKRGKQHRRKIEGFRRDIAAKQKAAEAASS